MAATPWASDRNWELVFEDDFDGSSLNEHNWSRIDYVGYNAPDWRKYQSRDESLVEFREKDGNSAMTLWGKYGDYTTQTNQTATAKNIRLRRGIFPENLLLPIWLRRSPRQIRLRAGRLAGHLDDAQIRQHRLACRRGN